jgi:YjbE family integral membrane protein
MELFSPEFFSALAAIIVIDLVLAGDNAIVIALAARNLPPHLRNRAVLWGTVGAIVVRTAMTLVVVWLLKVPGLLLAGGALLVWIAYKLLAQGDGGGHTVESATTFWGAMKTIVIADAVMGLDNVLAVAGAAHGSFLLVVLGLLISIPIVIWGSQIILKFVERYPAIVYIGAAVLAWTAVKMMVSEPLLKDFLTGYPIVSWLAYLLVVGGVLGGGFVANQGKLRARVARHLVDLVSLPPVSGDRPVARILVPVDGSEYALQAARLVMNRALDRPGIELHLVHVRTPFKQHVARFVARSDRESYHREEAERAMRPARELLDRHKVPYAAHVELGDRAERIVATAQRVQADRIVMGTARKNSLTRLIEDSVTHRVIEQTPVPVEIVVSDSVSRVERVGVPACIGTVLLAVMIAIAL